MSRITLPLLGHHEETLHQEALQNLRTNALEEAQWALVLNNIAHHLDKTLEWLALSPCRRLRL